MTRRWVVAIAYLLVVSCVPFSAVVVHASAPSAVAACDSQADCQDSSCTSDDCDQPPPPVVVPVPVPRPNVNACVNLGGRHHVSVNGCI